MFCLWSFRTVCQVRPQTEHRSQTPSQAQTLTPLLPRDTNLFPAENLPLWQKNAFSWIVLFYLLPKSTGVQGQTAPNPINSRRFLPAKHPTERGFLPKSPEFKQNQAKRGLHRPAASTPSANAVDALGNRNPGGSGNAGPSREQSTELPHPSHRCSLFAH